MKNIYLMCQTVTNSAGTERALCNLANILANSGKFNVNILSIETTEGNAFYELNPSINLFHLGFNVGNRNKFKKIQAYIRFYCYLSDLNKKQGDNVFIGTYTPFNCVISLLGKCCTKIGCEHLNYAAASKFRKFARKIFYKKLNYTVLLTESDRKHYSFLKNTVVIPNSLSFERNKKSSYEQKNVLAIGRLMYQKAFDILIEIADRVKVHAPDWHFTIVGEGDDKEMLLSLIEEKHLENYVSILPYRKDVISLYHSASIYAMSSRFEGLPMVLIEAQSCGLPCISFDCPEGPSDLIDDGENGFLISPNDIESFSNKLLSLMNDEKLREKYGQKAFENSLNYSTDVIAKKWFDLLGGESNV